MQITPGTPAPDFSLYGTEKNKVHLSDQRGKNVVLLFFPLAFTGTCTKELCSVRDNISSYNNLNATVFGISVDAPPALARFRLEQHLNFELLSDFNREASTAYGTLYDTFSGWMKGVSKRAAFVIDATGVIRSAEVLENAGELPNFEAINAALESLH